MTIIDVTDFEAERPRLTTIASRILGSAVEADDVLQEAWLRASRADTDDVDNLSGWLTRIVTRLCLDHLRKRQTRSTFESRVTPDVTTIDPEADALLRKKYRDGWTLDG